MESGAGSRKVPDGTLAVPLSENERILAIAIGRRWIEATRLPLIEATLAALPEANAADLLHEQGMIDSDQRNWLRAQEPVRSQEARREPFIDQCLGEAAEQGASDLHLVSHRPPLCRCRGSLQCLGGHGNALPPGQLEEIVGQILPSGIRDTLARQGWVSLPYRGDRLQIRLIVGRDANGYFLSFRLPFPRPLELGELGIDEAMELTAIPSGLVILTGGSGHGKSTLLAALARRILRSRSGRLVLLEDLPECAGTEDGPRVVRLAFSELAADRDEILRSAFALDPDVLLVDTVVARSRLRLLVEETARAGALVLATLGFRGVAEALRALCTAMPKGASRSLLARTLRAVFALELVPDAGGRGCVVATERFRNVPAAAAAMVQEELGQMESVLGAAGGKHFQPIDDSLWRLFQQGFLTMQAAYARCRYRSRWVARMQDPDPAGGR